VVTVNNFSRITDHEVKELCHEINQDMKRERNDLLAVITCLIVIELGCFYGILKLIGVL
jgi:hypothetical protein